MDEVCDMKDCPMYGFFINMSKHPHNVALDARIKELDKNENGYIEALTYLTLQKINNLTRMRTLCSSCCHFSKPDIREILIKEEAKEMLAKRG